MTLPFTTRLIQLRDNRYSCVVECGVPDGRPAFYLHGAPASRIGGLAFHETAVEHGIRLLIPDRPGMGFSDPMPRRTLVDFADDLRDVAEWFGLDRFGVFGASGGAPYAVAAAYRIPERLTLAVAAMCPGPMVDDRRFLEGFPKVAQFAIRHGGHRPLAMKGVVKLMTKESKEEGKNKFTEKAAHAMPASDLAIQKWLEANPNIQTESVETRRQGLQYAAQDLMCIMGQSWGFQLDAVKAPLHIWHGESDGAVPVAGARLMSQLIPNNELHIVEGGHYIAFSSRDDIFASLASAP